VKRFAVILLILVLVVLGAALVVPSFIDWNRYRLQIAEQIEAITGRPVAIDGALSFQVLPSPTLSADGVRIANIDGGSTRDMARIGALRVAVNITDLLRGSVRVRSVRVVEPVILLERLEDGRVNWTFEPAGASGRAGGGVAVPMPPDQDDGPGDGAGDGAGEGPGLTVRLDSVLIEQGLVVYRDHASGAETRVQDIGLDLSAESLRGPFRAGGEITVQDIAIALDVAVGELAGGGATPVSADLLLPATGDTLTLSGLLHDAMTKPRFDGDLDAGINHPGETLAALGHATDGPVPPGPITLTATVQADQAATALDDLRFGLGSDEARGRIQARYGDGQSVPSVDATLSVRSLDLDSLLAALQQPGDGRPADDDDAGDASEDAGDDGSGGSGGSGGDADGETGAGDAPAPDGGFSLPTGLTANLDLSAEAVTWQGAVVRQAVLRAALAEGRLTIAEAGATLPGASDVTAVATLQATDDGTPQVDGTLRAQSGNLREVLNWLRVPVDQVSADRLRTLDLAADLGGTPTTVRINNLDLTLDTTRATGAAVLALGERPGIGLNLTVESLNLDAYLPGLSGAEGAAAGTSGAPASSDGAAASDDGTPETPDPAAAAAPAQGPPLLAGLGALNDFDANFRLAIGTLTADALPISGVRAEGSLVRGRLTLTQASIADVAGANLTATGAVSGFGGQASFEDMALALQTDDLARTARVLRLPLPAPAQGLGAVSQSVVLNGEPQALTISSRTEADGGRLDTAGQIEGLLTGAPNFDLSVNLRHPATVALVRRVAPDYDPAGAPLGALGLDTRARGTLDQVSLEDLDLSVGQTRLRGQMRLTLSGQRPHIAAGLSANMLPVHAFLPAARQALLRPTPAPPLHVIPTAAFGVATPRADAAPGSVIPAAWSSEPIDLSALSLLDADVNLRAGALIYREHTLENADISARLADGVLRVERLTGLLYGGQADGTLTVMAGNPASYDLAMTVDNFSVASLLGLDGAIGAVGTGSLSFDGASSGGTVADLIAALTGTGGLTLNDLDIKAGQVRGTAWAGVLEPIASLNDLAGSLIGNLSQSQRLADLDSRFSIDRGRLSFDPLHLVSALYEGTLAGDVNLLDWTIDAQGVADLADSPLKDVVGSLIKLPDEIPVSIQGALDSPMINLKTAGLPGDGGALGDAAGDVIRDLSPEAEEVIRDIAPEAERVLRDVAPGAENLLRGVLGTQGADGGESGDGGDGGSESDAAAPADGQGDPPPPQAPSPDAIINNLLKGLGN